MLAYPFILNYQYYESYYNKNDPDDQPSGAYIFRPMTDHHKYSSILSGSIFRGKNLLEIQVFRLKLYN